MFKTKLLLNFYGLIFGHRYFAGNDSLRILSMTHKYFEETFFLRNLLIKIVYTFALSKNTACNIINKPILPLQIDHINQNNDFKVWFTALIKNVRKVIIYISMLNKLLYKYKIIRYLTITQQIDYTIVIKWL